MRDPELEQMVAEVTAEAERVRREQLVREFGEERADELMLERQPGCTRIVLDGDEEDEKDFAFLCNPSLRLSRRQWADAGRGC